MTDTSDTPTAVDVHRAPRHKLLRTIRLDPSDTFVFEPAAAPGEWAVSGSFMFLDCAEPPSGRARQAFRSGFLGLGSFGWSTLVVVVEATAAERTEAVEALAGHLHAAHGAPSFAAARRAAEEEIAYAEGLAQHPPQTLVALHRTIDADGALKEQFRTLHAATAREEARMPCSAGAFAVVEEAEAALAATAMAAQVEAEEVDLAALMGGGPARAVP
jgi:hypothetical protein